MDVKDFSLEHKAELQTQLNQHLITLTLVRNSLGLYTLSFIPYTTEKRVGQCFSLSPITLSEAESFFKVSTVLLCSAHPAEGRVDGSLLSGIFMSDCMTEFYTKIKLRGKKNTTRKYILWTQIRNLDITKHHFMEQDIIKMSKSNKLAPKQSDFYY